MRGATCFSGIGAPECAMPGWTWAWSAEVEPFPSAVLAARHPGSVNLGDVLAPGFDERIKSFDPVDVLVGGPPCQAFSVAGDRASLSDPRGNLSLRWVEIIHAVAPVWAVTENVPGWLNTPDNAFGHFLGALVGADDPLPAPGGRGWPRAGMVAGPLARACWRVLDAQYFGLAQRRERVFVVSSSHDGTDPSQILFEPASVRRDTPPRRQERQRVTRPLAACSPGGSGYRNDADTAENLIAFDSYNQTCSDVTHTLRDPNGTFGDALPCVAYGGNDTRGPIEVSTALNAHGGPNGRLDFESETFVAQEPVAYACQGSNVGEAGTLQASDAALSNQVSGVIQAASIRRLTPEECEALQGLPRGYTAVTHRGKPSADGNRYRAIGNGMAVPCVGWILARIEAHERGRRPDLLGDAA